MSDRFQVLLAYDGTEFHGSQFQKELRTVQGEIEEALTKIGWQGKTVLFAGRTDAGVHAAGQVIAFDFQWDHTEKELNQALNAVLPQDISAVMVQRTRHDFHPRYDAALRKYHYQIFASPARDPLQERYAWRVWPELELRLMKKASRSLLGIHDFGALGIPHKPGGSTLREIRSVSWKKEGKRLVFEIAGNAFLYHMVRRIVMVLVKIGQGKEPVEIIKQYLENPSGPPAQGLAPAHGLSLIEVCYLEGYSAEADRP
jgi:tRNA pseudouridine38-40 synthase